MKKLLIIAVSLTLLLTAAGAALAETSASASASYMSRYVWRGITLSESYAVQPSVDFVKDNLNINMWSSYDGETNEAVETDLTVNYTVPVEALSLDIGWIYYALDGFDDTQEVYVSVAKDFGPVSPSLTAYYDTEVGTGWYIVAAVGYGMDINDKTSLSLGASASYQMDNNVTGGVDSDGEEYSALHNGELSAALSFAATDDITIEPMIAYTTPLSDEAKDAIKSISFDEEDSIAYGGITVSIGF
jgi:uncharacterized protein (TIGR02001 family)